MPHFAVFCRTGRSGEKSGKMLVSPPPQFRSNVCMVLFNEPTDLEKFAVYRGQGLSKLLVDMGQGCLDNDQASNWFYPHAVGYFCVKVI